MDFVISKVGLSICALLVASVLGQTLCEPPTSSERYGLETAADQIDDLLSALVDAGCETNHIFEIPSLATGSVIAMTFRACGVEVRSENAKVAIPSSTRIHLWEWDGAELNRSAVDELDSSHCALVAVTGDQLRIAVAQVSVQFVWTYMTFVCLA